MKQMSVFTVVEQISAFADVKQTSMSMNVDFMQSLCAVIFANRVEFFMFFSSVLGYLILCRARLPKNCACEMKQGEDREEAQEDQTLQDPSLYHEPPAPSAPLCEIVKSMQLKNKEAEFTAKEFCAFLSCHPNLQDISIVNDSLEQSEIDSELTELMVDKLPSIDLHPDVRTFEILFKKHAASQDFSGMQNLIADMNAKGMSLSARAMFFVMKGALQANDFEQSFNYFKELKLAWASRSTMEPIVPLSVMSMLVNLAWERNCQDLLIAELKGTTLPEKTIDLMLAKCVESNDPDVAASVEILARAQRSVPPDSTYSLLIQALTGRPKHAHQVVEEVLARKGSGFASDLAMSVISFCNGTRDVAIADRLFEKMKPKPVNVIVALAWFYIGAEQFEKVCDIYELHIQPICTSVEASLQESIVDAAVLCGRIHLAERLVAESRSPGAGLIVIAWRASFQRLMDAFARWNALVSYWVVLVF